MGMVKIKRLPGSTVTWLSNMMFSMKFPLEQDVFEVPEEWVAYIPGFRPIELVEEKTTATKSTRKPTTKEP